MRIHKYPLTDQTTELELPISARIIGTVVLGAIPHLICTMPTTAEVVLTEKKTFEIFEIPTPVDDIDDDYHRVCWGVIAFKDKAFAVFSREATLLKM